MDFLVALILCIFIFLYFRGLQTSFWQEPFGLLDSSWRVDILQKAHQGIWLGRDAAFTYGPLFQWLVARLDLSNGSIGSILVTDFFASVLLSTILLYGTVTILLAELPVWIRTLFFLLVLYFWMPFDWSSGVLKVSIPVFAAAVWLRLLQPPLKMRASRTAVASGAAGLLLSSFLVSADVGIYVAFGFLVTLATASAFNRAMPVEYLKFGTVTAAFVFVGVLAVNAWAGAMFDFHLWKAGLSIAKDYRWMNASSGTRLFPRFFAAAASLVALLALMLFCVFQKRKVISFRLLVLLVLGVFSLQSGIVRSDIGHVGPCLFPLIIFAFAALVSGGMFHETSRVGVLACLLLTAIFSGPYMMFRRPPKNNCSAGEELFSQVCMFPDQIQTMQRVKDFLGGHSSPGDSIAVFPYENLYGMLAGRMVAGGVLQNYIAAGNYLMQTQVGGLKPASPPLAVYSSDSVPGEPLDGVPNLSRSPLVWLYLQRWYSTEADFGGGILGLKRDDARGKDWEIKANYLRGKARLPVIFNKQLDLLETFPNPQDFDLLRANLRCNYPPWWAAFKPSRVVVMIKYEDGTEQNFSVVVPPNQDYDLWIYPWNNRDLGGFFSPDEADWHIGRKAIRSLSISFEPFDILSIAPNELQVNAVESVRLDLRPLH